MRSARWINDKKKTVEDKIRKRLHKEYNGDVVTVMKKACCVCDVLLDHRNSDVKSLGSLAKFKWMNQNGNTHAPSLFFKNEYTIPESHCKALSPFQRSQISRLCLSPRSVVIMDKNVPYLSICKECCRAKQMPAKAIKNIPIGNEPSVLAVLNDAELALVSRGRVSGHMFHIFAGAHKTIKTYHQIHVHNVAHTMGSLNLFRDINIRPDISCVLSGPFTPDQKALALRSVSIDTAKVIAAFSWLKENNMLYADIEIPDPSEILSPVIIDTSNIDVSLDNNIERTQVTTVIFPELGDVEEPKNDFENKQDLLKEVLKSGTPSQIKILSKPTRELVKTWKTEEFVKSFPRQFPFGLGLKPEKMSTDVYTKHLLSLSNNSFQKADFILVVANIHFKHSVVKNASLKCKYMSGQMTSEERFNGIDIEEIECLLEHPELIDDDPSSDVSYFMRQVFAISKLLPFSDEFTKKERTNLFSLCTQFGLPTGLLTVTPDDSDNFNMYIYKTGKEDFASKLRSPDCAAVKDYLSQCEQIRVDFPGYAEFEFENIMDIVITDVLGWDCDNHCSVRDEGLFGDLHAWFLSVEEQGRKTLHGHFLIWAKDWDLILDGAHACGTGKGSEDSGHATDSNSESPIDNEVFAVPTVPSSATVADDMETFLNHCVSTECFDIKVPISSSTTNTRQSYTIGELALSHDCKEPDVIPEYVYSTDQQLRHMRFQHCPSTPEFMQIAKCAACNKSFTMEDITANALSTILSTNLGIPVDSMYHEHLLRYIISISQSGIESLEEKVDRLRPEIKRFLVNLHRNLHRQCHSFTCFKKGCECRAKLPAKPICSSKCDFLHQRSVDWYDWTGAHHKRTPFRLMPKRGKLDVFTNTYNPFLSEVFHCNTNFQCGIDGAGIMYVTSYTCKSTRKEEKEHQLCVLESLKRVINKERANATIDDLQSDLPQKVAFRRVLASALSLTSNYSLAAPMAKYLVLHGSRFRCSHQFSHLPFYDHLNETTTYARLDLSKKNTVYVSARRDTYLFRPAKLEHLDPMTFYSRYQVQTAHASTLEKKECMRFLDNAPDGYKNLCLMPRLVATIPTIHHLLFQNASSFQQDIMCMETESNTVVEEQCRRILILFAPYRHEKDVLVEPTYKASLITKMRTKSLNPDFKRLIQNIQNCKNSLGAGHVPEILEDTTLALPESEADKKKTKKHRKPTEEVLAYIDQQMSNLVAEIDEAIDDGGRKDCKTITLLKLADQGAFKLTQDVGLYPEELKDRTVSLFKEDGTASAHKACKKRPLETLPPRVDKHVLLALQQKTTYRVTNLSLEELNKTSNINCTGSADSIVAWANAVFGNDTDQKTAFQCLIADYVLQFLNLATGDGTQSTQAERLWSNSLCKLRHVHGRNTNKRVIMFLTGPGGSGKSHVIHNILQYAKNFTVSIGQPFTNRTIVVTALTGVAATSILGETLHSAAGIAVNGRHSSSTNAEDQENDNVNDWKHTKLLIVDEISFASTSLLRSLATAVKNLKQNRNDPYGGITVCFSGDFSQLEPVSGTPIYKDDKIEQWYSWVNTYVHLRGGHRFTDNRYKEMLERLRRDTLTKEDYAILETRIVDKKNLSTIPKGTQIACTDNKDRCAMNNMAFLGHLKATHTLGGDPEDHTLIVKMSGMKWTASGKQLTDDAKHTIYENLGDFHVKKTRDGKFLDPFLKLYVGAPVMLTENDDVKNGIANGTTGRIKEVLLSPGSKEKIVPMQIDGYNVNTIDASDVNVISLEIELGNKTTKMYYMQATELKVRALMPIKTYMEVEHFDVDITGTQFTFLINHATTVHKLQGKTMKKLYIVNWSYSQNWVYVALSRVEALAGLFIRRGLNEKKNLRPRSELIAMTDYFERTKTLRYPDSAYIYN